MFSRIEQHFEKSLHTTNPQDHINHDTLNSSNKTNQKYRNNIENDHFYTKQRSVCVKKYHLPLFIFFV